MKADVLAETVGETVECQIQNAITLIAHVVMAVMAVMAPLGEKRAVGSGQETRLDVL